MRNFTSAIVLSCAVVAAVVLSCPCGEQEAWNPVPQEREAYAALMKKTLEAMPAPETVEATDKQFRPDMFHEFDKMKRMNPQTGEVPADGYRNAYRYIQKEWGNPTELSKPEHRSGYALNWEERGPNNIGGRTRAAMWDPNDPNDQAFFAGGVGGGLWYTDDVTASSPTWVNVNPTFSNVAVTCIGADPSNNQVMYYGTGEGWFNADAIRGEGVWKSTDGGQTWDILASTQNQNFYYCQDIVVTDDGHLYIASKAGMY
ncbi:MAG: hypothetical protein AAF570_09890, partial [Bacteroidota bacterium]